MMIDAPQREKLDVVIWCRWASCRGEARSRLGGFARRDRRRHGYRGNMKKRCSKAPSAARYALIIGDDELERGEAQLKDLATRRAARGASARPGSRGARRMTRISPNGSPRSRRRRQELAAGDVARRPRARRVRAPVQGLCGEIEPVAAAAREVRRLRAELEVLTGMLHDADAEPEARWRPRSWEIQAQAARGRARAGAQAAAARRRRRARRRCSKSAPAPAATRRRCSPATCCACTSASPRAGLAVRADLRERVRVGGYKEAIASISGAGVFAKLKFESGVHRVQRVPVTESGGRIHTSAATVAVLPEAEDVDVQIDDKDLRIDVYRSSGPAASRSTPPTARSGSPTCRPAWSSSSRTRSRSTRTRPRR
jgi:hypothetical protein